MEHSKMDVNFDFHKKMNYYFGVFAYLPDDFGLMSKFRRSLWRLFDFLAYLLTFLLSFSLAAMVVLEYDNLILICTSGGAFAYGIQAPLKLLIFRLKYRKATQTLRDVSEISIRLLNNPIKNPDFPELYAKYYKRITTIIPMKMLIEMVGMSCMNIFYMINVNSPNPNFRTLMAPIWTPFDNHEGNLNYLLSCLSLTIMFLINIARNMSCDLLFVTMIVVPTIQLKYLKRLLKNIIEVYREKRAEAENEMFLGRTEKMAVKEMKDNLRYWSDMHHLVLRSLEHVKDIATWYLLVMYFICMLLMFFLGIALVSKDSWDTLKKGSIVVIVSSLALQLYTICYVGDQVTEYSSTVADEGFEVDLLRSSKFFRRNYLFSVTRSKKAIVMKALYLFPLSSHTFEKMVKVTFSYFLTVVQIRQRTTKSSTE